MIKKILIIGFVWPEPKSSAAGNRIMQLIDAFAKASWDITFASAASDSEFMDKLAFPTLTRKEIKLNSADFDSFIADLNPSIVIFDRFMTEEQFGWRVAQFAPYALRILDTEDLRCLRIARQHAVRRNHAFEIDDLLLEETAKREIASIFRCDLSLIISEFEHHVLTELFDIDQSLLYYLPLFSSSVPANPRYEQRQDFVFIGNFLHEPNKDAVQFLKEQIWPLIHSKLPDAILNIYGAYPSTAILQWNDPKKQFFVRGRADESTEVISAAKIMLAPLRFGAGIKGKLLEAMQYGTPSVTTSIGAEAMHGGMDWNGSICDSPDDFANCAVALYQDERAWHQAQQNGLAIIEKRFTESNFIPQFLERISELRRNLTLHRARNFTGAMLMHHTMRSTEYMSRYIEAKNK